MFKKIILTVLAVFALVMTITPTYASDRKNVIDNAKHLTDAQVSDLESKIKNVYDNYHEDLVIVITDDLSGKTSTAFADDYYHSNGYGYGPNYSGVLMLVDLSGRHIHISTTGLAINILTDSRISAMINSATPYLSSGDFNGACQDFITNATTYFGEKSDNSNSPNTQYAKTTYLDKVLGLLNSWVVYVCAFVISIAITIFCLWSNRGKITITDKTYEKPDSFFLTRSTDSFLHTSLTQTKIVKNNDSSSTHSDSSGSSHGGGDGSF